MDGLFNGKPYEQMDDLGGKNSIFGNTGNTHLEHFSAPSGLQLSGVWRYLLRAAVWFLISQHLNHYFWKHPTGPRISTSGRLFGRSGCCKTKPPSETESHPRSQILRNRNQVSACTLSVFCGCGCCCCCCCCGVFFQCQCTSKHAYCILFYKKKLYLFFEKQKSIYLQPVNPTWGVFCFFPAMESDPPHQNGPNEPSQPWRSQRTVDLLRPWDATVLWLFFSQRLHLWCQATVDDTKISGNLVGQLGVLVKVIGWWRLLDIQKLEEWRWCFEWG